MTSVVTVGATKWARSSMLFCTDVKKNRSFWMWIGSPSAARATKHMGNPLFGEESRLGWSCGISSMHLDRAHMHDTCSGVGTMLIALNVFSMGTLNCLRLSGMFSSQWVARLAGTLLPLEMG